MKKWVIVEGSIPELREVTQTSATGVWFDPASKKTLLENTHVFNAELAALTAYKARLDDEIGHRRAVRTKWSERISTLTDIIPAPYLQGMLRVQRYQISVEDITLWTPEQRSQVRDWALLTGPQELFNTVPEVLKPYNRL